MRFTWDRAVQPPRRCCLHRSDVGRLHSTDCAAVSLGRAHHPSVVIEGRKGDDLDHRILLFGECPSETRTRMSARRAPARLPPASSVVESLFCVWKAWAFRTVVLVTSKRTRRRANRAFGPTCRPWSSLASRLRIPQPIHQRPGWSLRGDRAVPSLRVVSGVPIADSATHPPETWVVVVGQFSGARLFTISGVPIVDSATHPPET
jgi:hypothetical protein